MIEDDQEWIDEGEWLMPWDDDYQDPEQCGPRSRAMRLSQWIGSNLNLAVGLATLAMMLVWLAILFGILLIAL